MEWIKIEDQIPEWNKKIIGYFPGWKGKPIIFCELERQDKDGYYFKDESDYLKKDLTHWMPLPEPPKRKLK